jgi:hypothetical protein
VTSNFPPLASRHVPRELAALHPIRSSSRGRRLSVAEVSLRGTAIAPVEPFVRRDYGADGWSHFLRLIDPVASAAMMQPVIATNRYPFTVALSIVDGLVALADGRAAILREFATFNLDYATNVVFRAIFKFGSPEFMVARSDQVWKKLYSNGRMVCDVSRARSRVELHDFPYLSPNYEKLVTHSIEAVLVKAGARSVVGDVTPRELRGDRVTEFVHEWA